MDSPNAWLEFPSGERIFLGKICTIGRTPENRVVIPSERVSRRHAVLRLQGDGSFQLMDMGSSNGTFLNGQRLRRPAQLQDGNIIEVGMQKMTFRAPPNAASPLVPVETIDVPCWLMTLEASLLGCRSPSVELIDKTAENWSERCQRVIGRYRGNVVRAANEGLLVFWRADGPGANRDAVVGALKTIRSFQSASEEFHFTLHYGSTTLRPSVAGGTAPSGPEVIFAMQLQRLISTTVASVLISEAAHSQLADTLELRMLSSEEMRGFRGAQRFYTIAQGA